MSDSVFFSSEKDPAESGLSYGSNSKPLAQDNTRDSTERKLNNTGNVILRDVLHTDNGVPMTSQRSLAENVSKDLDLAYEHKDGYEKMASASYVPAGDVLGPSLQTIAGGSLEHMYTFQYNNIEMYREDFVYDDLKKGSYAWNTRNGYTITTMHDIVKPMKRSTYVKSDIFDEILDLTDFSKNISLFDFVPVVLINGRAYNNYKIKPLDGMTEIVFYDFYVESDMVLYQTPFKGSSGITTNHQSTSADVCANTTITVLFIPCPYGSAYCKSTAADIALHTTSAQDNLPILTPPAYTRTVIRDDLNAIVDLEIPLQAISETGTIIGTNDLSNLKIGSHVLIFAHRYITPTFQSNSNTLPPMLGIVSELNGEKIIHLNMLGADEPIALNDEDASYYNLRILNDIQRLTNGTKNFNPEYGESNGKWGYIALENMVDDGNGYYIGFSQPFQTYMYTKSKFYKIGDRLTLAGLQDMGKHNPRVVDEIAPVFIVNSIDELTGEIIAIEWDNNPFKIDMTKYANLRKEALVPIDCFGGLSQTNTDPVNGVIGANERFIYDMLIIGIDDKCIEYASMSIKPNIKSRITSLTASTTTITNPSSTSWTSIIPHPTVSGANWLIPDNSNSLGYIDPNGNLLLLDTNGSVMSGGGNYEFDLQARHGNMLMLAQSNKSHNSTIMVGWIDLTQVPGTTGATGFLHPSLISDTSNLSTSTFSELVFTGGNVNGSVESYSYILAPRNGIYYGEIECVYSSNTFTSITTLLSSGPLAADTYAGAVISDLGRTTKAMYIIPSGSASAGKISYGVMSMGDTSSWSTLGSSIRTSQEYYQGIESNNKVYCAPYDSSNVGIIRTDRQNDINLQLISTYAPNYSSYAASYTLSRINNKLLIWPTIDVRTSLNAYADIAVKNIDPISGAVSSTTIVNNTISTVNRTLSFTSLHDHLPVSGTFGSFGLNNIAEYSNYNSQYNKVIVASDAVSGWSVWAHSNAPSSFVELLKLNNTLGIYDRAFTVDMSGLPKYYFMFDDLFIWVDGVNLYYRSVNDENSPISSIPFNVPNIVEHCHLLRTKGVFTFYGFFIVHEDKIYTFDVDSTTSTITWDQMFTIDIADTTKIEFAYINVVSEVSNITEFIIISQITTTSPSELYMQRFDSGGALINRVSISDGAEYDGTPFTNGGSVLASDIVLSVNSNMSRNHGSLMIVSIQTGYHGYISTSRREGAIYSLQTHGPSPSRMIIPCIKETNSTITHIYDSDVLDNKISYSMITNKSLVSTSLNTNDAGNKITPNDNSTISRDLYKHYQQIGNTIHIPYLFNNDENNTIVSLGSFAISEPTGPNDTSFITKYTDPSGIYVEPSLPSSDQFVNNMFPKMFVSPQHILVLSSTNKLYILNGPIATPGSQFVECTGYNPLMFVNDIQCSLDSSLAARGWQRLTFSERSCITGAFDQHGNLHISVSGAIYSVIINHTQPYSANIIRRNRTSDPYGNTTVDSIHFYPNDSTHTNMLVIAPDLSSRSGGLSTVHRFVYYTVENNGDLTYLGASEDISLTNGVLLTRALWHFDGNSTFVTSGVKCDLTKPAGEQVTLWAIAYDIRNSIKNVIDGIVDDSGNPIYLSDNNIYVESPRTTSDNIELSMFGICNKKIYAAWHDTVYTAISFIESNTFRVFLQTPNQYIEWMDNSQHGTVAKRNVSIDSQNQSTDICSVLDTPMVDKVYNTMPRFNSNYNFMESHNWPINRTQGLIEFAYIDSSTGKVKIDINRIGAILVNYQSQPNNSLLYIHQCVITTIAKESTTNISNDSRMPGSVISLHKGNTLNSILAYNANDRFIYYRDSTSWSQTTSTGMFLAMWWRVQPFNDNHSSYLRLIPMPFNSNNLLILKLTSIIIYNIQNRTIIWSIGFPTTTELLSIFFIEGDGWLLIATSGIYKLPENLTSLPSGSMLSNISQYLIYDVPYYFVNNSKIRIYAHPIPTQSSTANPNAMPDIDIYAHIPIYIGISTHYGGRIIKYRYSPISGTVTEIITPGNMSAYKYVPIASSGTYDVWKIGDTVKEPKWLLGESVWVGSDGIEHQYIPETIGQNLSYRYRSNIIFENNTGYTEIAHSGFYSAIPGVHSLSYTPTNHTPIDMLVDGNNRYVIGANSVLHHIKANPTTIDVEVLDTTKIPGVGTGSGKWWKPVNINAKKVYFLPHNASTIGVVYTDSDTFYEISSLNNPFTSSSNLIIHGTTGFLVGDKSRYLYTIDLVNDSMIAEIDMGSVYEFSSGSVDTNSLTLILAPGDSDGDGSTNDIVLVDISSILSTPYNTDGKWLSAWHISHQDITRFPMMINSSVSVIYNQSSNDTIQPQVLHGKTTSEITNEAHRLQNVYPNALQIVSDVIDDHKMSDDKLTNIFTIMWKNKTRFPGNMENTMKYLAPLFEIWSWWLNKSSIIFNDGKLGVGSKDEIRYVIEYANSITKPQLPICGKYLREWVNGAEPPIVRFNLRDFMMSPEWSSNPMKYMLKVFEEACEYESSLAYQFYKEFDDIASTRKRVGFWNFYPGASTVTSRLIDGAPLPRPCVPVYVPTTHEGKKVDLLLYVNGLYMDDVYTEYDLDNFRYIYYIPEPMYYDANMPNTEVIAEEFYPINIPDMKRGDDFRQDKIPSFPIPDNLKQYNLMAMDFFIYSGNMVDYPHQSGKTCSSTLWFQNDDNPSKNLYWNRMAFQQDCRRLNADYGPRVEFSMRGSDRFMFGVFDDPSDIESAVALPDLADLKVSLDKRLKKIISTYLPANTNIFAFTIPNPRHLPLDKFQLFINGRDIPLNLCKVTPTVDTDNVCVSWDIELSTLVDTPLPIYPNTVLGGQPIINLSVYELPYRRPLMGIIDEIPLDGMIDLTGIVDIPLSLKWYDFYINGRRLSERDILIMSPTKVCVYNTISTKTLAIYRKDKVKNPTIHCNADVPFKFDTSNLMGHSNMYDYPYDHIMPNIFTDVNGDPIPKGQVHPIFNDPNSTYPVPSMTRSQVKEWVDMNRQIFNTDVRPSGGFTGDIVYPQPWTRPDLNYPYGTVDPDELKPGKLQPDPFPDPGDPGYPNIPLFPHPWHPGPYPPHPFDPDRDQDKLPYTPKPGEIPGPMGPIVPPVDPNNPGGINPPPIPSLPPVDVEPPVIPSGNMVSMYNLTNIPSIEHNIMLGNTPLNSIAVEIPTSLIDESLYNPNNQANP